MADLGGISATWSAKYELSEHKSVKWQIYWGVDLLNTRSWYSIFKCSMWWSAVHCTIGYPNMQVSALHTGHGHFSLWTPIPECMCTGQQLSVADTTMLGCRESPLAHPSSPLPTNRFLFVNTAQYHLMFDVIM